MTGKYRLGKSSWRSMSEGSEREWMISNGIGGFSNCSIIGNMCRVQSAYLVAALNPPVDRISILSNTKEMILAGDEEFDLECQTFSKGDKQGHVYLESFTMDVVPTYSYQFGDMKLNKTIALEYGKNTVVVAYEYVNGSKPAIINIKPAFSCSENGVSNDKLENIKLVDKIEDNALVIKNLNDKRYTVRLIASEGRFDSRIGHDCYVSGKTFLTDLKNGYSIPNICFTPFDIVIDAKPYEKKKFYLKCTVEELDDKDADTIIREVKDRAKELISMADYHDGYMDNLVLSADNFIVDRKSTGLKTILAGYPWFSDWGRDTMIAFQGLTLCTGRFDDARAILESFAMYEKDGLIPNLFPSSASDKPMYNTVDASMWYFYSVYKYLEYTGDKDDYQFIRDKVYDVLKKIYRAYRDGTDFSIGMDEDGLIHAGDGLDQVTWMDVRVGEWVVTPRHGKPVEINALWYNALMVLGSLSERFGEDADEYYELAKKVKKSFVSKFWNQKNECLFDVIDENDDKIRPNQIWAISLPYSMLDKDMSKKIVNVVYKHLYTCYGLRTLSYKDKEFKGEYKGELSERDAAYHMGTAWPFLLGGFITAYCKTYDYSNEAVESARQMCFACFDHLWDGCLNGISEVFDGMNPCTGNGCFNQAWSVGELLRAYYEDIILKGAK